LLLGRLQTALDELIEPTAAAPASLKPTLDVFLGQLPAVLASRAPDMTELATAATSLSNLAANESIERQAATIAKSVSALDAGVKKKDIKTVAAAAVTVAEQLTDYVYAYEEKEKPLQDPVSIGAPAVYDADRKRIELPVSGKRI